ncbi:MAG: hypothetical protein ACOYXY_04670 [Thermodesulfobacteriota bacterium]
MPGPVSSRNINAKEAVSQIRGPLSNAQLMEQFKISVHGFADLLKQLFEKGLITQEDLTKRGIRFKVLRKDEKPTRPPVILAPPPDEGDEEFVDTVTLTEMLTFKEFGAAPEAKDKRADSKHKQKSESEAPEPETEEKKAKFTLTGLFKKGR